jgi:hypothetical protein
MLLDFMLAQIVSGLPIQRPRARRWRLARDPVKPGDLA